MRVIAVFVFLAAFALINCSGNQRSQQEGEGMQEQLQQAGISIDPAMLAVEKCLPCGMDLREHAIMDTVTYEGKLYGFCSTADKEKFLANPEKYTAMLHQGSSEEMDSHEQTKDGTMEHQEHQHDARKSEEVRENVSY